MYDTLNLLENAHIQLFRFREQKHEVDPQANICTYVWTLIRTWTEDKRRHNTGESCPMFPSGRRRPVDWDRNHPGRCCHSKIYLTQGYTPSSNGLRALPPFVCSCDLCVYPALY